MSPTPVVNSTADPLWITRTTLLWLLLFQMTGVGCTGPIWALIQSAQPTTSFRTSSLVLPEQPILILVSVALGYVLPAGLMGLSSPTTISEQSKQLTLVAWNIFPLWVLSVIVILSKILPVVSVQGIVDDGNFQSRMFRQRARWACTAAVVFCFAAHVAVLAFSLSTICFPSIFKESSLDKFHPTTIFVPPLSISKGDTEGDGVRSFMLWDQAVGYTTVIVQLLFQLRNAATATSESFSWNVASFSWNVAIAGTLISTVAIGPGTTLLMLGWLRNELCFGDLL